MYETGTLRCVVCDDHEALRLGVVRTLEEAEGLEVVGQADDGDTAIAMITRRRPAVAVVDLFMPGPDGIEVARAVAEAGVRTAVLIYSASDETSLVKAALAVGAAGYVLKRGPVHEITRAVRAVARGERYVDPTLVGALLDEQAAAAVPLLSRREAEVLQLLADGLTTQAVAAGLFLAPTTVRSYIENAMQKLGTHSRTGAVAAAMRDGIIS